MKQILVFILLFSFSSTLFAQQNPRIEYRANNTRTEIHASQLGKDSVRYTIAGVNDTIVSETLWLNGSIKTRSWKKDSLYQYRQFGQLAAKNYLFYDIHNQKTLDSLISYAEDGTTVVETNVIKNNLSTRLTFDDKGQLLKKYVYAREPAINYNYVSINDQKTRAHRFYTQFINGDSIRFSFDTTFYPNNRIRTLELRQQVWLPQNSQDFNAYNPMRAWRREYFDENGQLLLSLLPDNLKYFSFKDNVNCYYGFKNYKGDTLIQARFDNVTLIDDKFYICQEGDGKMLMGIDGKMITKEKMSDIKPLRDDMLSYATNNYPPDELWSFLSSRQQYNSHLFAIRLNDKYGVMDTTGRIILPPQYDDEIVSYNSFSSTFGTEKTIGSKLKSMNTIDSITGKVIGNEGFRYVRSMISKDFLVYSDTVNFNNKNKYGLVNRQGDIIIPNQYHRIELFQKDLFWVYTPPEIENDYNDESTKLGLFDARNKQWILEPVFRIPERSAYLYNKNSIVHDVNKRKCGVIDLTGQWLMPLVYDTIVRVSKMEFVVSQKGQSVVFDAEKQRYTSQSYEHLSPFFVYNQSAAYNYGNYQKRFFVAKKQGKWGIIDGEEKTVIPFEYDYGGSDPENRYIAVLVKNNKARFFNSDYFPKPMNNKYTPTNIYEGANTFKLYGTNDVFVTNEKSDIIVPPQYKVVSSYMDFDYLLRIRLNNIIVIEDKQGNRKILFPNTNQNINYPFKQPLLWANTESSFVLLGKQYDSTGISIANLKTGNIIQRIESGGLSIGDVHTGTYFVKTNLPPSIPKGGKLPFIYNDTFAIDDNGWLMHDATGKQIAKDSFRLPISFHNGIGYGMIGEKYGLWKSDGSVIAPPQYENAFYDNRSGTFALFQNIGLNNWLVLFDKNGKQLINTGRYDGISDFYGRYALVKKEGKIGLIDTLGNEIIPLTDASTATHINFRDSLELVNNNLGTCRRCDTVYNYGKISVVNYDRQALPLQVFGHYNIKKDNHPDSLKLTSEQRNIVWNMLVAQMMQRTIHTAADTKITKPNTFKTYLAYNQTYRREYYYPSEQATKELLFDLFVDNQYIAFSILKDTSDRAVYHNYTKRKDKWIPLSTNDLFNLHPDNTRQLNDLLVHKIAQLQNKDIDCGTYSSFWERGNNHYLVNSKGIIFYYLSKLKDYEKYQRMNNINFENVFVPIAFTWAELKPFLKK